MDVRLCDALQSTSHQVSHYITYMLNLQTEMDKCCILHLLLQQLNHCSLALATTQLIQTMREITVLLYAAACSWSKLTLKHDWSSM